MYSPAAIENAPASRPATPGEQDEVAAGRGTRTGDAHHEGEVRDEAVRDAEDHRPERPRPAGPMPPLAGRDLRGCGHAGRRGAVSLGPGRDDGPGVGGDGAVAPGVVRDPRFRDALPDLGVLALVCGDRLDLGRALRRVDLLLVALEGLDQVTDGVGAEDTGDGDDDPDAQPRPTRWRDGRAELAQPVRPDLRVAALVAGDRPERLGPPRLPLDS